MGISKKNNDTNTRKEFKIAVGGNPNVGKSTLFNALTGLKHHTGNWTGKTVTSDAGSYIYNDNKYTLIDLPGCYSLLSSSEEEGIARDYICYGDYDYVIIVCDGTALERNLNLVLQIMEITNKVIVCVNLLDEAKKHGVDIDLQKLEDILTVPVIGTSARSGEGLSELKERLEDAVYELIKDEIKVMPEFVIKDVVYNGQKQMHMRVQYNKNIEDSISEIGKLINIDDETLNRWTSLRLLENDKDISKDITDKYKFNAEILSEIDNIRLNCVNNNNDKMISDSIVETMIGDSEIIANEVIRSKGNNLKWSLRIDNILTSKALGIPVMVLMLIFILYITVTFANYPSQLLAGGFGELRLIIDGFLLNIGTPIWLYGILMDGVYATLTWVVSVMLPPMAIFFPMFTLLEDLGVLPRIAFNLDGLFKKCSACGKQALSMCMGLGCNAVGVIGTRIIDSPREKLIAIITNSLMPCNGRFPMIITIATIFIGSMIPGIGGGFLSALTIATVIVIGVIFTFIVSKFLSKTFLKGVSSSIIMELPPYRKPQIGKVIIRSILDRTLKVLGRAVIVALPAGAFIWMLANISLADVSILKYCADFLDPLGQLMGLDGFIILAFILGLPANEIVVPILIMSYLGSNTMIEFENINSLKNLLLDNGWTMLTAVNFLMFSLIHWPCATTLLTIKKETNSIKWTSLSFLIPTILGIATCIIIATLWRLVV